MKAKQEATLMNSYQLTLQNVGVIGPNESENSLSPTFFMNGSLWSQKRTLVTDRVNELPSQQGSEDLMTHH